MIGDDNLHYRYGHSTNMNPNSHDVTQEYSRAMVAELNEAIAMIGHCIGQLSEQQLWWRPNDSMNSIANLILHLSGNVRQWIVSGVGGVPDTRVRQQEFDQRGGASAESLRVLLGQVEKEARQTLESVTAENLVRRRVVQGNDVTGAKAIVHSISHFRGHTQEIVYLTRMQIGDRYQFDFVPEPE